MDFKIESFPKIVIFKWIAHPTLNVMKEFRCQIPIVFFLILLNHKLYGLLCSSWSRAWLGLVHQILILDHIKSSSFVLPHVCISSCVQRCSKAYFFNFYFLYYFFWKTFVFFENPTSLKQTLLNTIRIETSSIPLVERRLSFLGLGTTPTRISVTFVWFLWL